MYTFHNTEGKGFEIDVGSFEFEHGISMYDRIGITESINGTVFTNVAVSWLVISAIVNCPWVIVLDLVIMVGFSF